MGKHPLRYSRRELVEMAFGSAAAGLFASAIGCDRLSRMVSDPLPGKGELILQNHRVGHRIRDFTAPSQAAPAASEKHQCVIIGAGVSGLSAAWHAERMGIEDILVLELEAVPGGTSRCGNANGFEFPWGAHYLPVPKSDNQPLVEFLTQCDVLRVDENGVVEVSEQYLCREPEERVFAQQQWWGGLYPDAIATPADRNELQRFLDEMKRMSAAVGEDGKRMFALPTRQSSSAELAKKLDQISMAQWMSDRGFDSPPLRWLVDYACRDDYGLRADQTSAWAGVFYFAARLDEQSGESQSVMTWPTGNGFLVKKLVEPLGDRLRLNQAVARVTPSNRNLERSSLMLDVMNCETFAMTTMEAEHVIVAVPQFVATRMLDAAWMKSRDETRDIPTEVFSYGSWVVANIHLRDRPEEAGFPMSWDNVISPSGSLGYVNATHQLGMDHGPTVLTWYQALTDGQSNIIREKLLTRTWSEVAETVIMDLELAHPDIRPLITRLDAMIWGHAMPQPHVGAIFHPARAAALRSIGNVHFACTDLSGIALFEEAFDHGYRAAAACV